MGERDILQRIKHLVEAGAWLVSNHAFDRAEERGEVHVVDIENALLEAHAAQSQPHGPWLVYGPDVSGHELGLVVEIDEHALVVTVLP